MSGQGPVHRYPRTPEQIQQILGNWRIIANNLNISEEAIAHFNHIFATDDAFKNFENDQHTLIKTLKRLDPQAISLRLIELSGEEQNWFKEKIENELARAREIASIINQITAITQLRSFFEQDLAACREALAVRAIEEREVEVAKQLLLDLAEALLDAERLEELKQFVDAHLLSITSNQDKQAWLTAKTEALCQENKQYLVWQSFGLTLNQAELLTAVNDKIDETVAPEKQESVKRCLTRKVAAKAATEQRDYLLSLYQEAGAFQTLLAAEQDAAVAQMNVERVIVTSLRHVHRITDSNVIAKFRKVVTKAAPDDFIKQRDLFRDYDKEATGDAFTLAGFKAYVRSKVPVEPIPTAAISLSTAALPMVATVATSTTALPPTIVATGTTSNPANEPIVVEEDDEQPVFIANTHPSRKSRGRKG
ncbi:hypothetical protein [Candidatus Berkiella aquae]|uniref:Uncharacterized protein n=1 Tax=Candidatus Berkiella aquae TaxID=295108 RepID=A0A0Q9YWT7_9GAMM|nr:hypothetical protein [Candidatus Berkiella aquae]MCS5711227.1 hypothetical protein [Candidatus Berkiella aquae]